MKLFTKKQTIYNNDVFNCCYIKLNQYDCYAIKTGNCILKQLTIDEIKKLPYEIYDSNKNKKIRHKFGQKEEVLLLYNLSNESKEIYEFYLNNYIPARDCLSIAFDIINNGYRENEHNKVKVYLYRCGHYYVDNGRHRFCIQSILNLDIKIHYETSQDFCFNCSE